MARLGSLTPTTLLPSGRQARSDPGSRPQVDSGEIVQERASPGVRPNASAMDAGRKWIAASLCITQALLAIFKVWRVLRSVKVLRFCEVSTKEGRCGGEPQTESEVQQKGVNWRDLARSRPLPPFPLPTSSSTSRPRRRRAESRDSAAGGAERPWRTSACAPLFLSNLHYMTVLVAVMACPPQLNLVTEVVISCLSRRSNPSQRLFLPASPPLPSCRPHSQQLCRAL